jgi:hypothetical protein
MPKIVVDLEEFYTIEEARIALGISIATLWRRINDSSIRPVKIANRTLIPKTEVERFQKENNGEKA